MNSLNILVLAGGPSAEREVSLMGGRAVADALAGLGHRVVRGDAGPDDLSALDAPGIDCVFPVLHGEWGEDGQLQAILDARGLRYVGSGPDACGLAMDKSASKTAFLNAGLSTPPWRVVSQWSDELAGPAEPPAEAGRCGGPPRLDSPMRLPLVVKPVTQGSSVDLTIARDAGQLKSAVEDVCRRYGRCLVERFVAGRELTVGVLDESALPPIEIVVHGHEFYNYPAKYYDDSTEYLIDSPMGLGERDELMRLALSAHVALGCRDFSRVDFIAPPAGPPAILEVNAIPGFTSHSLLPKAAAAVGLDFAALCGRLVELAMARPAARRVCAPAFGRAAKPSAAMPKAWAPPP